MALTIIYPLLSMLLIISIDYINTVDAFDVKWLGLPLNERFMRSIFRSAVRRIRKDHPTYPTTEYHANGTAIAVFCFTRPVNLIETNSVGARKWTLELGGANSGDQRVPATFVPLPDLIDDNIAKPVHPGDRTPAELASVYFPVDLSSDKQQEILEFKYFFRTNRRISLRERTGDGLKYCCWGALSELQSLPKLRPGPDYRWILHKKRYFIDRPRFRLRRPGITLVSPPFSIKPQLSADLRKTRSLALMRSLNGRSSDRYNSLLKAASDSGMDKAISAVIAGEENSTAQQQTSGESGGLEKNEDEVHEGEEGEEEKGKEEEEEVSSSKQLSSSVYPEETQVSEEDDPFAELVKEYEQRMARKRNNWAVYDQPSPSGDRNEITMTAQQVRSKMLSVKRIPVIASREKRFRPRIGPSPNTIPDLDRRQVMFGGERMAGKRNNFQVYSDTDDLDGEDSGQNPKESNYQQPFRRML